MQLHDVTSQIALSTEVWLTHARKTVGVERVQVVEIVEEGAHVIAE